MLLVSPFGHTGFEVDQPDGCEELDFDEFLGRVLFLLLELKLLADLAEDVVDEREELVAVDVSEDLVEGFVQPADKEGVVGVIRVDLQVLNRVVNVCFKQLSFLNIRPRKQLTQKYRRRLLQLRRRLQIILRYLQQYLHHLLHPLPLLIPDLNVLRINNLQIKRHQNNHRQPQHYYIPTLPIPGLLPTLNQITDSRFQILHLMREIFQCIFHPANLSELVDDADEGVEVLADLLLDLDVFVEVEFDGVHQGEDHLLEDGVEEGRLLLVFLEDVTDAVFDLLEREGGESGGADAGVWVHVFVEEVQREVVDVFDQGGFLGDEEVGVLRHALVDQLVVGDLAEDHLLVGEGSVLEVQVHFVEVEELGFLVESHEVVGLIL